MKNTVSFFQCPVLSLSFRLPEKCGKSRQNRERLIYHIPDAMCSLRRWFHHRCSFRERCCGVGWGLAHQWSSIARNARTCWYGCWSPVNRPGEAITEAHGKHYLFTLDFIKSEYNFKEIVASRITTRPESRTDSINRFLNRPYTLKDTIAAMTHWFFVLFVFTRC